MPERVLITGAAGRLGGVLARGLAAEGLPVLLTDVRSPSADLAHLPFRIADLTRAADVEALFQDVGAVVHVAGHPNSRDWGVVGPLNIEAAWNVFRAAAGAGVSRLVYASSTHVVGRYPADIALETDMPLWPDGPYGMSKALAEGLLAEICRTHPDLVGFAVRIGACREDATDARQLRTWLSHPDWVRLVKTCLDFDQPGLRTVWGFSDNRRAPVDRAEWDAIGYHPQDDAERFVPALMARGADTDAVSEWPLLGGSFVVEG